MPLYNFADNHDVNRVASTLRHPAHLYPLHLLLFTMPGVPSVYAGSEWGIEGVRKPGDDRPLRPALSFPAAASRGAHPDLAPAIARFAAVRHHSPALRYGSYRQRFVAPEQLVFSRQAGGEHVVVAVNAAGGPVSLEVALPERDGTSFLDLLEPGPRWEVLKGRLRLDGVPGCWGRILARQ